MDKIVLKKPNKGKKPTETKYDICEDVFDLYDSRFMVFKQYLTQALEHIDEPLFESTFDRFSKAFNAGDYVKGMTELINFKTAVEQRGFTEDPLSMAFALICLEKDEDQTKTDENYLKEKLERFRREGLIRGQVEESVINFIAKSPMAFGDYSQIWEILVKRTSELSSTQ